MDKENRKLIKFSNYSLCVTLPKSTIKALGWEKGDVVKMTVDEEKGEITVTGKVKNQRLAKKEVTKKPVEKKVPSSKSRW